MVIEQSQLDLVLNRRIRRREIQLPVCYGRLGERRKCPAHVDGVYELKARVPYARHRLRAKQQPTRAQAVLWLIAQCEQPRASTTITVRSIKRSGDVYVIGFVLGDQRASLDTPRLPARKPGLPSGDYVTSASRALAGTDDEVSPAEQAIYAEQASNGLSELRNGEWRTDRVRLLKAIQAVRLEAARQNVGNGAARRRLKTVEHNLRALHREIAS